MRDSDKTPASSKGRCPSPSARKGVRIASFYRLVKRAIENLHSKMGSSRKSIIRYIRAHNTITKETCIRRTGETLSKMLMLKLVYKTDRNHYKLTAKGHRFGKREHGRRRGKKGGKKHKGGKKKGRKGVKGRRGRRRRRRRRGRKGKKPGPKRRRRGRRSRKAAHRQKSKSPRRRRRRHTGRH